MDYKFLILLILLIGAIFLITREFNKLKEDIEEKHILILSSVDGNSKVIKAKIQTDIAAGITKIRGYNTECIQQIRKIDALAQQPITNMSNHYTDSESEKSNKNLNKQINYLSDVRNDKVVNEPVPESFQYYMSEMSLHKPPKIAIKKESIDSHKESKEQQEPKEPINQQEPKSDAFLLKFDEPCEKDKNEIKTAKEEEKSKNSVKIENVTVNDEDLIESDTSVTNKSETHVTSDSTEVSIEIKKPIKDEYESITIGSSKNRRGVKPSALIKKHRNNTNKNEEIKLNEEKPIEIQEHKDDMSVSTVDIAVINLDNFKPIETYKIDDLRKIAKMHAIPVSCKEGTARRQLMKNELYSKIKDYLNDKKKSE